ncbi:sulfocyanin-like copper-binding protein [Streptomyces sp. NPDC096152]|uniref:sulfocyanin-like copper-binding protein n=1 Tax=Streptomyces sp. NPDC096152 TaxID=3366078 RepID=UPI00380D048D
MSTRRRPGVWQVVAAAAAALVLGIASTVLLAATHPFPSMGPSSWRAHGGRCAPPAPGARTVDVLAGDMGHMGPGPGPRHGMRMMNLTVHPATVPAGKVTLRVFNAGRLAHEVVVLPLLAGQSAGNRAIGSDLRIAETGSRGEASRTCGAGTGDGIAPGTRGWTTLTLAPGRYELVCNFPGHYASGMYTELDATR